MNKVVRHIMTLMFFCVAVFPLTAQEAFTRGIEQVTFVPKGQWITGLSVSYSQTSQDNYQFLILEGVEGNTYSVKVSPMLFYCFKDDMAAGAKFTYTRSMNHIERGSLVFDSETSYDIDNLYTISQNYSTTLGFRYYMSLGNSKRFGLCNEVQLQVGGGESKLATGKGETLTGTFQRNFGFDLGLAPGMMVFLNNYSAIEVNVGVLGFSYNHSKAITDQVYVGNYTTQSARFKINLFSITFGVAFYL